MRTSQANRGCAVALTSLVVLLSAFTVPAIAQTSSPDANREREENYIYAAIVRHVVKDKGGVLFLRMAHKDPGEALLGRLIGFDREVVPASRAIPEKPQRLLDPLRWRDRKTGRIGGLLDLDAVEWITQKLVRVGGKLEGNAGAFKVAKEAGRWRVKDFEVAGREF